MAIPSITPFPTPAPARPLPPEVFRPAADATIAHIPTFVSEANAQAAALDERVQEALDAGLEQAAANAAAATQGAVQAASFVGAAEAAADLAEAVLQQSIDALQSVELFYFSTKAALDAGLVNVPTGALARVLADETRGGEPTEYFIDGPGEGTLSLDFIGQVYESRVAVLIRTNFGASIFLPNLAADPAAPAAGYRLYALGGALKGRGSGGTITTIGAA